MFSLDSRGGHNRYKFNKDFLKTWSNEMAYVLGFLYADGNITNAISSRTQYIHFYSTDRYILENIKIVLSSNHILQTIPARTQVHINGIYRSKEAFRLRIGSREMFEDLLKLGVVPNKSKIITFPYVPKQCMGNFIRGYFDGDGCVFLQKAKGITKPIIIKKLSTIFTSGSYQFLRGIAEVLKNTLSINHDKVYDGIRSFQLRYSTKDSIEIFKFMYNYCSSGLYLRRKTDRFNEYFQIAPRKIDVEVAKILYDLSYGSVLK